MYMEEMWECFEKKDKIAHFQGTLDLLIDIKRNAELGILPWYDPSLDENIQQLTEAIATMNGEFEEA